MNDGAENDKEKWSSRTFNRFVIESLPIGVVTVDSFLRITQFNPWAEKITGFSEEEIIGRDCGEILHAGACTVDCAIKQILRQEKTHVQADTNIRRKDGKNVPVRLHTAGLFDDAGKLIGGLEAFIDISYTQALERERTNFVSMLAHDMKSPVVAIHGLVQRVLKESGMQGEIQRGHLEVIEKEATRLESLINEFLEFSRLQAGQLKLTLKPTCLETQLHELYDTYSPLASKKGLKLELHGEKTLPIIYADRTHLYRVFANLLDNAVKYSDAGTITITGGQTDGEVVVRVEDQGSGIDSRDLPHIFDPFHRGHGARERDGFGLGLAAVERIVREHGGRVHVASEPGKGSAFTVFLPKKTGNIGNLKLET